MGEDRQWGFYLIEYRGPNGVIRKPDRPFVDNELSERVLKRLHFPISALILSLALRTCDAIAFRACLRTSTVATLLALFCSHKVLEEFFASRQSSLKFNIGLLPVPSL